MCKGSYCQIFQEVPVKTILYGQSFCPNGRNLIFFWWSICLILFYQPSPHPPSWPAVAPFREPNVTPQVIVKSEPLRTRPRGGVRGGFYDLIEEISGITDLSNISENVGFSLWFDEFLLCPYNIVPTGSYCLFKKYRKTPYELIKFLKKNVCFFEHVSKTFTTPKICFCCFAQGTPCAKRCQRLSQHKRCAYLKFIKTLKNPRFFRSQKLKQREINNQKYKFRTKYFAIWMHVSHAKWFSKIGASFGPKSGSNHCRFLMQCRSLTRALFGPDVRSIKQATLAPKKIGVKTEI